MHFDHSDYDCAEHTSTLERDRDYYIARARELENVLDRYRHENDELRRKLHEVLGGGTR